MIDTTPQRDKEALEIFDLFGDKNVIYNHKIRDTGLLFRHIIEGYYMHYIIKIERTFNQDLPRTHSVELFDNEGTVYINWINNDDRNFMMAVKLAIEEAISLYNQYNKR